MTKKTLLEALATYPDDTPIAMAVDPEGNSFSLLHEVGIDTAGLPVHGVPDVDLPKVVILWPM